jgi:Protein kinase domain
VAPEGERGRLVGTSLGGYQLVELLGTGGMAEVYRALEPQLAREVAVKVLPAELAADAGYVERFRNEARQVAALSHPNVVPIYRFGEDQGLLFLVMPVYTESLRQRMIREGIFEPAEAARLCVQVAAGLDAAHRQGLVHRDVKPENILLNEEGRAMLTDFGIARVVDAPGDSAKRLVLAGTGLPAGTPEYMAPEQLRGGPVDQRADVYALGTALYEMLTGTVPHAADTIFEVAARTLTERTPLPSTRNPIIWPELEEVVLWALAPNADDRYADMRSFVSALRRAVLQRGAGTAQLAATNITSRPILPAGAQAMSVVPYWEDTQVMAVQPYAYPSKPIARRRAPMYLLLVGAVALFFTSLGLALTFAPHAGLLGMLIGGGSSQPDDSMGSGPGIAAASRVATPQVTAPSAGTATTVPNGGPAPTATIALAGPTSTAAPPPASTATSTPTSVPAATPVMSAQPNPIILNSNGKHSPCTNSQDPLTLTNTGSAAVSWSFGVLPPGVTYTETASTPGHLNPGQSTVVTFTNQNQGSQQCGVTPKIISVNVSAGTGTSFTLYY